MPFFASPPGTGAPIPASEQATIRKFVRMLLLQRYGYRAYGPAFLFRNVSFKKGNGLTDTDLQQNAILPLTSTPWREEEFKAIQTKGVAGTKEGSIILTAEIVRARTIGPMYFDNFGLVRKYFAAMFNSALDQKRELTLALTKKTSERTANVAYYFAHEQGTKADFKAGTGDEHQSVAAQNEARAFLIAKNEINPQLESEITELKRQLAALRSFVASMNAEFQRLADVYEKTGFAMIVQKSNRPWDIVTSGYSLDPDTGIVTFADPACWMARPFLLDGDLAGAKLAFGTSGDATLGSTEAVADGGVLVTVGCEINSHTVSDYSIAVLFASDEGTVSVAGLNRPTPVKSHVIHDPSLRMFIDEDGQEMNIDDAEAHALATAGPTLSQSLSAEGKEYTISGFVPVPPQIKATHPHGVESVQYVLESNGLGRTHMTVNAPGRRMPLGPAGVLKPSTLEVKIETKTNLLNVPTW